MCNTFVTIFWELLSTTIDGQVLIYLAECTVVRCTPSRNLRVSCARLRGSTAVSVKSISRATTSRRRRRTQQHNDFQRWSGSPAPVQPSVKSSAVTEGDASPAWCHQQRLAVREAKTRVFPDRRDVPTACWSDERNIQCTNSIVVTGAFDWMRRLRMPTRDLTG